MVCRSNTNVTTPGLPHRVREEVSDRAAAGGDQRDREPVQPPPAEEVRGPGGTNVINTS